jgi:hypothetical protein
MPSDHRLPIALDAIARPLAAYRSAIVAAHARASALVAGSGEDRGGARMALGLGAFGQHHLDAGRLAALRGQTTALDAVSRIRIQRATAVLSELAEADTGAFVVDVRQGGDLGTAVAHALAQLGRAFGAALAVGLVRSGRFIAGQHDRLLGGYPFDAWSKAERSVAPPLVVRVDGADLCGGALADFLDGAMHVVLLVDGPCPPAPLVRLITPGTLVLQTRDGKGLDRFSSYSGPAVVMLPSAAAIGFLHDPALGKAPWQRLRVWDCVTDGYKRLGGWSAAQQQEEVAQLEALAAKPQLSDAPLETLGAPTDGDPVARLTAWLLTETDAAIR